MHIALQMLKRMKKYHMGGPPVNGNMSILHTHSQTHIYSYIYIYIYNIYIYIRIYINIYMLGSKTSSYFLCLEHKTVV